MVLMDETGIFKFSLDLYIFWKNLIVIWTSIDCISACSDFEPTFGPRLCVLKREEGETYDFHLRVEKAHPGHVVRNVVSGGVGQRCGLRDGDRLLEVNNCFVDDLPHPEVTAQDCDT